MRGRFYLACALTLFGASAWAQTPAAASAPTTTFRARTQMVYLPVVVRDKHGDPVRGLKAEQFHVEQDGRRQKLSVFEEVTNESQANDAKKLGHMIDASGFKVLPREVEEVLLMHPKIHEAVVAGVPDAYRGETVKAFVVLRPGEHASAEEIIDFCRLHLAPFKVPRKVDFRTELPKSMVGKYLRRVLVQEEAGASEGSAR